jgi:hypothetical protein
VLTPRQRRTRQALRGVLIGAAAFLSTAPLTATAVLAASTWTTSAIGPGTVVSAVVPTGKLPTATVQPTSIKLEWAPSTYPSGREVASYIVRRQAAGSKDTVEVCAVTAPVRTCDDTPPAGQPVVYTVVPAEQLWRGPASAPTNPVTLAAPTPAGATLLLPSITPSPSATASATPSASASPISTPSPTPTATPDPTPPPTPTPAPS